MAFFEEFVRNTDSAGDHGRGLHKVEIRQVIWHICFSFQQYKAAFPLLPSGPSYPLEIYIDNDFGKGLFSVHSSNEIPDLLNGQEMLKGKTYEIMVTMTQWETDIDAMTSLSPERRNCWAEHERSSKIYQNYRQVNWS